MRAALPNFGLLRSRQINTGDASFWQLNSEDQLFARGCAYDYVTRVEVVAAWERAKQTSAALLPPKPPSRRQVARELGLSHFFVTKVIEWHERGMPVVDRPRGGAYNYVLEGHDLEYLEFLVLSGSCYCDRDYWVRMCQDIGCLAAESTIQKALVSMQAKLKSTNKEPFDKYTVENTVRLAEYMDEITDVPRARFRFYDQTGINYKDILRRKRRQFPGVPCTEFVASSFRSSTHYSTFGLTSISPDMPPVFCHHYEATAENGHLQRIHGRGSAQKLRHAFSRRRLTYPAHVFSGSAATPICSWSGRQPWA